MHGLTKELQVRSGKCPAVTYLAFLVTLLLVCVCPVRAQQEAEQKGIDSGNYNVKQAVEFGYRFTDFTGNQNTYDTFVNLQQGPRVLDYTLEMRSLNHAGSVFDRFYFSNFGYGGDPNNVSRLRISKNKWYNFNALFRRDVNFWDYSLQANPLNPTTAFANGPAGFNPAPCTDCVLSTSPHMMNTRRRLGDYNLTVLPQSRVRLRLGYSRNVAEGPSFTTFHEGTEALLLQNWKTTVNNYRLGVDFKVLPRTNISYDQFWSYYKGDSGVTDMNQLFPLANGTLVDLGVSLNAGAGQPCANTFGGPPAGAVNPACNAFLAYSTHGRGRTKMPTEQLSMQSSYFKNLDLSARFSYSGGDMLVDGWTESLAGRASRTNIRNRNSSGPIFGRRVAATGDLGATWYITKKLSFLDSFHYSNFHDPGESDGSICQFFSPGLLTPARVFAPGFVTPVTCAPPPDGVAGTPVHSTSSGPDISLSIASRLLKQEERTNLAELEYQFTPKYGARLGYRFRHREIADYLFAQATEIYFPNNANRGDCALVAGVLPAGCVANGDGSFTFVTPSPEPDRGSTLINEHSAVLGLWARPMTNWRISFDTELMSADNAFTRVSPRQTQEYRIRSTYKPVDWLHLSGSFRIWEGRNNVAEINNLQHNRSYGFSATFEPTEKVTLELGYDYDDVYSSILICYVSSTSPAGLSQCPGSTVLVQQLSTYTNTSHYGYFDARWTPVKRLTARLGANLTGTSGNALLLNPIAPPGVLDSRFYKPYAGIDFTMAKGWTWKTYWNYYGYGEGNSAVAQDLYAPRNFHGNMFNLSIRYAF